MLETWGSGTVFSHEELCREVHAVNLLSKTWSPAQIRLHRQIVANIAVTKTRKTHLEVR